MTAVERRPAVRPQIAALRPRRVELGLIALIAIVVVSAYGLASLGESASVPADIGPFLAWMLGLFFFVHVAVRRFARAADPVLLPMALLLNGIGYVMIARLSEDVEDGSDLAGLQSVWTAVGIVAFVVTLMLVPRIRALAQYRYLLGIGGLVLLALPLLPIGVEIRGEPSLRLELAQRRRRGPTGLRDDRAMRGRARALPWALSEACQRYFFSGPG